MSATRSAMTSSDSRARISSILGYFFSVATFVSFPKLILQDGARCPAHAGGHRLVGHPVRSPHADGGPVRVHPEPGCLVKLAAAVAAERHLPVCHRMHPSASPRASRRPA